MSTSTLVPDRAAWREAVAEIATKAHEKLPESSGRIDSAVKLVLAGDVELLPDGAAMVASRSKAGTEYALVNGVCECGDYAQAPHHFCAHRLAAAIMRRVQELTPPQKEAAMPDGAPREPSPLTPDSSQTSDVPTGIPEALKRHVVWIQNKPFVRFSGLLELAHQRGRQELRVDWTFNDADLSLAHAVAVFPFGTFEDSGDATKDNVTKKVAPHFRRVSLTRASARALRLALGVEVCAVEELSEE